MTVGDLIEKLKDLDPSLRVTLPEEWHQGIIRAVEVVDVYEAKCTDVGDNLPEPIRGHENAPESFDRVYRLGHKHASPYMERIIILDDKVRK